MRAGYPWWQPNQTEDAITPKTQHTHPKRPSQADFQELLHDRLRRAIWFTQAMVLDEELSSFVGAPPYAHTADRRDQRNGHYSRDLVTTMGKLEALPVPRTRRGFRTRLFERYQQRQTELDSAIGEMFVYGTSTARVGEVVETLTGTQPSSSAVSRVYHALETEFETWKTRPLAAAYAYLFADGTYFTVIYDGQGQNMPILAVMGIMPVDEREVLVFTVGERENQKAWEDLFEQLKQCCVQTVGLWITDGHQAMRQALHLKFPAVPRQRCIVHKLTNVLSYIPEKQQAQVEPELRAIFYQDSWAQAN